MATIPGPTSVVSGAEQFYTVDGNDGVIRPSLVPSDTRYDFTLDGVPLHQTEAPMELSGSQLFLAPLLYVGKGGSAESFFMAAVEVMVELRAGEALKVSPVGTLNGHGVPGIEAAVASLAYDAATSTLTGDIDLTFPKLTITGSPSTIRTGLVVENGCIDSLSASAEGLGERSLAVGPGKSSGLALTGAAVTGICDAATFGTGFRGTLYFGRYQALAGFRILDSMWLYEPAHTLTLLGGTPIFLNRPVTGARARLVGLASGDVLFFGGELGTGGLANGDVVRGALTAGAISPGPAEEEWRAVGFLDGTFTLSADCTCPSAAGDECRIARTALLELYKGTPQIGNVSFGMSAEGTAGGYYLQLRGNGVFAGLSRLAVTVEGFRRFDEDGLDEDVVVCSLGANLAARPTAGAAGLRALAAGPVERTATLERVEDLAVFAARGIGGTLPSIYLVAPDGRRITPTTTSLLRGATYATDPEDAVALFAVTSAAAGTWTLGEDNLDESDVRFTVLAPQPAPVTAFIRLETGGTSVAIDLTVTPPASATSVTLYYSRTHDGLPEGVIADAQPATSGRVAATWDVAALPTGSYYVFAVTDDGMNPPVTTYARTPVTRDFGGLAAPTGLSLRRDGATVTLSWTPSTSAAVVGYTVRYTDDLQRPGYPLSAPAPLPNGATVGGLDTAKSYRFCVVGYDLDGNLTPETPSISVGASTLRRHLR